VLKAPLLHGDRAEHRHRSDMPAFDLVIKSNAAWVVHAIAVADATVVAVWVAVFLCSVALRFGFGGF
jgi:hypothetical protein